MNPPDMNAPGTDLPDTNAPGTDPAVPHSGLPDPAVPGAAVPDPAVPGPAVSVIMAVHNGLPYLEDTLRSVMAQTLREIEIIVADDGSTDATPQVLARLAAEDPRIRISLALRNEGPSAARNRAIGLARAAYVAVMDADDIAVPHRLAVQKDWLDRHPEAVMVAASIRKIGPDGRVLGTQIRDYDAFIVRWLVRFSAPLVHSTLMFRRLPAAGPPLLYAPELRVSEDYDLTARATAQGQVVSLPDVLVDWRIHPGSLSAVKRQSLLVQSRGVARGVHARDLPEDIRRAMDRAIDILRGDQPVAVRDVLFVIATLRRMIAHDRKTAPGHLAPMRREAVRIVVFWLGNRGIPRGAVMALVALAAPDLVGPGVTRFLSARLRTGRRASVVTA